MQSGLRSDDVFRGELAKAAAGLTAWAKAHEDCAASDIRNAPGYWKMAVAPRVTGACPFEVLLRSDQRYDLAIGGEFYEDLEIGSFALFQNVVEAIAHGNVTRILTTSALTGALQSLETRVALPDGTIWSGARSHVENSRRCPPESELNEVRRFLPYRR